MAKIITRHGGLKQGTGVSCPECRSTMTYGNAEHRECKTCGCAWKTVPDGQSHCENCGRECATPGRCDPCGWVYGRRGWRQLGVYDD